MEMDETTAKKVGIPFLPDEDYAKAIGQFRLQLNAVFQPFQMYGMDTFVPGAINEVIQLAEDFSLRVRGDRDKPISIDYIRRRKR